MISTEEANVICKLNALTARPGFIHALVKLIYRDTYLQYTDTLTNDALQSKRTRSTLLRSELNVLIGLTVQNPLSLKLVSSIEIDKMAKQADQLLQDLHNALIYNNLFTSHNNDITSTPASDFGSSMYKELFMYSAEYPYFFQYQSLSVDRYAQDSFWLQREKGFTISDVSLFVDNIHKLQLEKLNYFSRRSQHIYKGKNALIDCFIFTPEEVVSISSLNMTKVRNIISAFSLTNLPDNTDYTEIGAYNKSKSHPIIPFGLDRYCILQLMDLAASAYESPAYWLLRDRKYSQFAAKNRGKFAEDYIARRLSSVFGRNNVYENVVVKKGKKDHGEIDVLVIFGGRALIVQVKSKPLTENSRRGDIDSIKSDFDKSTQASYEQGVLCLSALNDLNYQVYDSQGDRLSIDRNLKEAFIICASSEFYPGLTFQARERLRIKKDDSASLIYVADIFTIDVLCEILNSPFQLLYYLHRRTKYWTKLMAGNEFSVLGFHLENHLFSTMMIILLILVKIFIRISMLQCMRAAGASLVRKHRQGY